MNLLLTLLDGVPPEALPGMGLLFIILPIAALLLLIWLFKRYKRKKEEWNICSTLF